MIEENPLTAKDLRRIAKSFKELKQEEKPYIMAIPKPKSIPLSDIGFYRDIGMIEVTDRVKT